MIHQLLEGVKFRLKGSVENSIYCQYYALQVLYHFRFLLPHDADYRGVTRLPIGNPGTDGVLDVGANLGLSALSFRKLLPRARILSLEPNPCHAKWLARIKDRDKNFDYLLVGAGESNASFALHVPYYRTIPLHTMASLQRADLEEACNNLYARACKHIRIEVLEAKVLPIDQLGLSPELIKIDAEGFELAIVKGSMETVRRARPYLLLENNPKTLPPIQALLAPLGYQRHYWDNWKRDFTRSERASRNVYLVP
jgi:FkbM family methyltransferase